LKESKESRRVGLARALSKLGFCSRSRAGELIRAGRVRLNRQVQRDPEAPVRVERDRVEVDGVAVGAVEKVYLMLNKPRGVVTTAADEKDRDTVYKFLDGKLPWVPPVGRLDKASEGLLLLTNDSEWSARITAPETHLEKLYHVQVRGAVDSVLLESMVRGIRASDGELLRAKSVRVLREGERNMWLLVVLDEGKNRQIRRMLEQKGIEVLRLIRVAIGPLELGELKKGGTRALTANEKLALDVAMRPH
jgi:23S rRNA pseudouridine2605 synthase